MSTDQLNNHSAHWGRDKQRKATASHYDMLYQKYVPLVYTTTFIRRKLTALNYAG